MRHAAASPLLLLLVLSLGISGAGNASAQEAFETTGARALGMGGAFVAVADDSSATYWNPAGLPGIRYVDVTMDRARLESSGPGSGLALDTPGWRSDALRFSFATPVLAFSYAAVRTTGVRPAATAALDPGRQEEQASPAGRTLRTQHFGITLVQSIGDAVVVGSTLRLVRAGGSEAAADPAHAIRDAVRQAAQIDPGASTHFDADVGVLGWIGRLRLGLVARNLAAPEYHVEGGESWDVDRQVRAGVSWGGEPARGQRPWAVALDGDLTTTSLPDGPRRSLAAGGERWWLDRRVALRAGVRMQTVDAARPAVSGGLSAGIRAGVLIDAHAAAGEDGRDRGWGASLRLTF